MNSNNHSDGLASLNVSSLSVDEIESRVAFVGLWEKTGSSENLQDREIQEIGIKENRVSLFLTR